MPSRPQIITASPENWCESTTETIGTAVKSYIEAKGECSLMLIGVITAKQLYQHWANINPWDHRKIKYYFGDERCVPKVHQDSNYCMVKQNLFPKGTHESYTVNRMEGELSDLEEASKNY